MIVTTTPTFEGRSIASYGGIVVGEAIPGLNVFQDIFAGITDIIVGRSSACEVSLGGAPQMALRELEERTRAADALVGVGLDDEVIDNMPMASTSGTAVTLR